MDSHLHWLDEPPRLILCRQVTDWQPAAHLGWVRAEDGGSFVGVVPSRVGPVHHVCRATDRLAAARALCDHLRVRMPALPRGIDNDTTRPPVPSRWRRLDRIDPSSQLYDDADCDSWLVPGQRSTGPCDPAWGGDYDRLAVYVRAHLHDCVDDCTSEGDAPCS